MIDLSHPIAAGMPVFPGDPEVGVVRALMLERDGAEVGSVALGSHTGTHVDAPAHVIAGGRRLDEIPLDELAGKALVLHVEDRVSERSLITAEELGLESLASVPRIVVVATGWDRHFGTPRYLRNPGIAPEAATRLVALGMRVLAVDLPSVDRADDDALGTHRAVLGADGVIVENLRGLDQLGERAGIGIFPLPLAAADGAPARVVAWGGGRG